MGCSFTHERKNKLPKDAAHSALTIYPRDPRGLIMRPVSGLPNSYRRRVSEQLTSIGLSGIPTVHSDGLGADPTIDLAKEACYFHSSDGKEYSYDLTYKEGVKLFDEQLRNPVKPPALPGFGMLENHGVRLENISITEREQSKLPEDCRLWMEDTESLMGFLQRCRHHALIIENCAGFVFNAPANREILKVMDGRYYAIFKAKGSQDHPEVRKSILGQYWYKKEDSDLASISEKDDEDLNMIEDENDLDSEGMDR
mmetsp:Transcript_3923/g.9251  ORF Transcript_3923/g.9251 Transcript_3923/m.9251 type:complete len:255 (-) Transcript_3923:192-956(-)